MLDLEPLDWTPGWRESGEFFQQDEFKVVVEFEEQVAKAGFKPCRVDFKGPGHGELRWEWNPDCTVLRWIPRTEAAALWLRLNAPG